MNNLAQRQLPNGDTTDQIRDVAEYLHVVRYLGVEGIIEDVSEEGQDGSHSIE